LRAVNIVVIGDHPQPQLLPQLRGPPGWSGLPEEPTEVSGITLRGDTRHSQVFPRVRA